MTRFIIVDVEGEGGISPYSGRMTEFGCIDLQSDMEFHGVLWPATPNKNNPAVPFIEADAVPFDHSEVFNNLKNWLDSFDDRIVFVSDNPAYDFMWMAYYCDKYLGYNPFGHSGRRIADLYAGLTGKWRNTSRWKKYRITEHTHNPVDDARGNREALIKILRDSGQKFTIDDDADPWVDNQNNKNSSIENRSSDSSKQTQHIGRDGTMKPCRAKTAASCKSTPPNGMTQVHGSNETVSKNIEAQNKAASGFSGLKKNSR